MASDRSWQAQQSQGFDLSHFTIEWERHRVTCPQSQTSVTWSPSPDETGQAVIHVRFEAAQCRRCPVRGQCTQAARGPRTLKLRPQAEHEALQTARVRQMTPEFKVEYAPRAGIEGTLSQGVRAFELRKTRYIGLVKTHLQHLATAAAINFARFVDWVNEAVVTRAAPPFAKLGAATCAA